MGILRIILIVGCFAYNYAQGIKDNDAAECLRCDEHLSVPVPDMVSVCLNTSNTPCGQKCKMSIVAEQEDTVVIVTLHNSNTEGPDANGKCHGTRLITGMFDLCGNGTTSVIMGPVDDGRVFVEEDRLPPTSLDDEAVFYYSVATASTQTVKECAGVFDMTPTKEVELRSFTYDVLPNAHVDCTQILKIPPGYEVLVNCPSVNFLPRGINQCNIRLEIGTHIFCSGKRITHLILPAVSGEVHVRLVVENTRRITQYIRNFMDSSNKAVYNCKASLIKNDVETSTEPCLDLSPEEQDESRPTDNPPEVVTSSASPEEPIIKFPRNLIPAVLDDRFTLPFPMKGKDRKFYTTPLPAEEASRIIFGTHPKTSATPNVKKIASSCTSTVKTGKADGETSHETPRPELHPLITEVEELPDTPHEEGSVLSGRKLDSNSGLDENSNFTNENSSPPAAEKSTTQYLGAKLGTTSVSNEGTTESATTVIVKDARDKSTAVDEKGTTLSLNGEFTKQQAKFTETSLQDAAAGLEDADHTTTTMFGATDKFSNYSTANTPFGSQTTLSPNSPPKLTVREMQRNSTDGSTVELITKPSPPGVMFRNLENPLSNEETSSTLAPAQISSSKSETIPSDHITNSVASRALEKPSSPERMSFDQEKQHTSVSDNQSDLSPSIETFTEKNKVDNEVLMTEGNSGTSVSPTVATKPKRTNVGPDFTKTSTGDWESSGHHSIDQIATTHSTPLNSINARRLANPTTTVGGNFPEDIEKILKEEPGLILVSNVTAKDIDEFSNAFTLKTEENSLTTSGTLRFFEGAIPPSQLPSGKTERHSVAVRSQESSDLHNFTEKPTFLVFPPQDSVTRPAAWQGIEGRRREAQTLIATDFKKTTTEMTSATAEKETTESSAVEGVSEFESSSTFTPVESKFSQVKNLFTTLTATKFAGDASKATDDSNTATVSQEEMTTIEGTERRTTTANVADGHPQSTLSLATNSEQFTNTDMKVLTTKEDVSGTDTEQLHIRTEHFGNTVSSRKLDKAGAEEIRNLEPKITTVSVPESSSSLTPIGGKRMSSEGTSNLEISGEKTSPSVFTEVRESRSNITTLETTPTSVEVSPHPEKTSEILGITNKFNASDSQAVLTPSLVQERHLNSELQESVTASPETTPGKSSATINVRGRANENEEPRTASRSTVVGGTGTSTPLLEVTSSRNSTMLSSTKESDEFTTVDSLEKRAELKTVTSELSAVQVVGSTALQHVTTGPLEGNREQETDIFQASTAHTEVRIKTATSVPDFERRGEETSSSTVVPITGTVENRSGNSNKLASEDSKTTLSLPEIEGRHLEQKDAEAVKAPEGRTIVSTVTTTVPQSRTTVSHLRTTHSIEASELISTFPTGHEAIISKQSTMLPVISTEDLTASAGPVEVTTEQGRTHSLAEQDAPTDATTPSDTVSGRKQDNDITHDSIGSEENKAAEQTPRSLENPEETPKESGAQSTETLPTAKALIEARNIAFESVQITNKLSSKDTQTPLSLPETERHHLQHKDDEAVKSTTTPEGRTTVPAVTTTVPENHNAVSDLRTIGSTVANKKFSTHPTALEATVASTGTVNVITKGQGRTHSLDDKDADTFIKLTTPSDIIWRRNQDDISHDLTESEVNKRTTKTPRSLGKPGTTDFPTAVSTFAETPEIARHSDSGTQSSVSLPTAKAVGTETAKVPSVFGRRSETNMLTPTTTSAKEPSDFVEHSSTHLPAGSHTFTKTPSVSEKHGITSLTSAATTFAKAPREHGGHSATRLPTEATTSPNAPSDFGESSTSILPTEPTTSAKAPNVSEEHKTTSSPAATTSFEKAPIKLGGHSTTTLPAEAIAFSETPSDFLGSSTSLPSATVPFTQLLEIPRVFGRLIPPSIDAEDNAFSEESKDLGRLSSTTQEILNDFGRRQSISFSTAATTFIEVPDAKSSINPTQTKIENPLSKSNTHENVENISKSTTDNTQFSVSLPQRESTGFIHTEHGPRGATSSQETIKNQWSSTETLNTKDDVAATSKLPMSVDIAPSVVTDSLPFSTGWDRITTGHSRTTDATEKDEVIGIPTKPIITDGRKRKVPQTLEVHEQLTSTTMVVDTTKQGTKSFPIATARSGNKPTQTTGTSSGFTQLQSRISTNISEQNDFVTKTEDIVVTDLETGSRDVSKEIVSTTLKSVPTILMANNSDDSSAGTPIPNNQSPIFPRLFENKTSVKQNSSTTGTSVTESFSQSVTQHFIKGHNSDSLSTGTNEVFHTVNSIISNTTVGNETSLSTNSGATEISRSKSSTTNVVLNKPAASSFHGTTETVPSSTNLDAEKTTSLKIISTSLPVSVEDFEAMSTTKASVITPAEETHVEGIPPISKNLEGIDETAQTFIVERALEFIATTVPEQRIQATTLAGHPLENSLPASFEHETLHSFEVTREESSGTEAPKQIFKDSRFLRERPVREQNANNEMLTSTTTSEGNIAVGKDATDPFLPADRKLQDSSEKANSTRGASFGKRMSPAESLLAVTTHDTMANSTEGGFLKLTEFSTLLQEDDLTVQILPVTHSARRDPKSVEQFHASTTPAQSATIEVMEIKRPRRRKTDKSSEEVGFSEGIKGAKGQQIPLQDTLRTTTSNPEDYDLSTTISPGNSAISESLLLQTELNNSFIAVSHNREKHLGFSTGDMTATSSVHRNEITERAKITNETINITVGASQRRDTTSSIKFSSTSTFTQSSESRDQTSKIAEQRTQSSFNSIGVIKTEFRETSSVKLTTEGQHSSNSSPALDVIIHDQKNSKLSSTFVVSKTPEAHEIVNAGTPPISVAHESEERASVLSKSTTHPSRNADPRKFETDEDNVTDIPSEFPFVKTRETEPGGTTPKDSITLSTLFEKTPEVHMPAQVDQTMSHLQNRFEGISQTNSPLHSPVYQAKETTSTEESVPTTALEGGITKDKLTTLYISRETISEVATLPTSYKNKKADIVSGQSSQHQQKTITGDNLSSRKKTENFKINSFDATEMISSHQITNGYQMTTVSERPRSEHNKIGDNGHVVQTNSEIKAHSSPTAILFNPGTVTSTKSTVQPNTALTDSQEMAKDSNANLPDFDGTGYVSSTKSDDQFRSLSGDDIKLSSIKTEGTLTLFNSKDSDISTAMNTVPPSPTKAVTTFSGLSSETLTTSKNTFSVSLKTEQSSKIPPPLSQSSDTDELTPTRESTNSEKTTKAPLVTGPQRDTLHARMHEEPVFPGSAEETESPLVRDVPDHADLPGHSAVSKAENAFAHPNVSSRFSSAQKTPSKSATEHPIQEGGLSHSSSSFPSANAENLESEHNFHVSELQGFYAYNDAEHIHTLLHPLGPKAQIKFSSSGGVSLKELDATDFSSTETQGTTNRDDCFKLPKEVKPTKVCLCYHFATQP